MKRSFPTPRNRAVRMRHMRRRLYLQDGVLSVRFIKFLEVQTCTRCLQPRAACVCHQPDFDERPQVWTRCAGDGAAWCANPECKRTFFRNKETDTLCPDCWAASLDMPSPPWPGGAA